MGGERIDKKEIVKLSRYERSKEGEECQKKSERHKDRRTDNQQ